MTKKDTDKAKETCENLLKRLEQQGVKTSVVRRANSEKIYITIDGAGQYTCRDYGQAAMLLHGVQAGLKLRSVH